MDTKKISSVAMFYADERAKLFAATSDDFFKLIDDGLALSDLRGFVERANTELDPERERKHQEERAKLAAFIEQAQPVIDAYADDAPPHPQWSERQLCFALRGATSERNYTIRQRDHLAQFGPDYMIQWECADGTTRPQRNDEYQSQVALTIATYQATIDQITAIMVSRGIEVPA